ncbi:MAG: c-type cytochrome [Planctomycetes bacterium]|nr:c-type cytochrome [Planctomycetota bacterium]
MLRKRLTNHASRFGRLVGFVSFGLLSLVSTGCREQSPVANQFEPNFLFAKATEIGLSKDEGELDPSLQDSRGLIAEWFGTLENPKIPEVLKDGDYADLISESNLKLAVGTSDAPGIYVQQCVSCHGLSGQGRGNVAASQDPYPRDFRMGVFKFKSSPRSARPLKEDIEKTLRVGLSGSQMPIFNKLSDQEIKALVDYVVFLSIRGEFERRLIQLSATELEGERLYDPQAGKSALEGQLSNASDALTQIADRWVQSIDAVEEFPRPDFPIVGSETQENRAELLASIEKGKALFASEVASCAKCHGADADGKGNQLPDYDDWTKDWTSKVGLLPTDLDALLPLMARGGMKPQPLKPRNILEGHFRGGRTPEDLYRRIRYGIPGSPMPAAAVVQSREEPGLLEEDIWHLVNYVLSIASVPALPLETKVVSTQ